MGCVYRRGNMLWIKYYRNGKPYQESSKSDKLEVAKRLLKKREGEISEGRLPRIYFDKVRFDELADDFLQDYRVNGYKFLFRAEICVTHLEKHFKGLRVPEITTPKINHYIEVRLKEGAAPATVNNEIKALKRMLNLGAKQTPPKVDRVPYISMLKVNNARKGFFEHGDFLALRENLPDYLKGFATFGYKSGWRFSEICNLTWSQVDLDKGIVRIEVGDTKNDEARTFYLDNELKEVFMVQLQTRKKKKMILPYVFPNRRRSGKIVDIRKAWKKACTNAEIGDRLFHDFRRTAIRNMVRAGIPERVAMMVSGHKTRSVFERYNIVNDKDLMMASQKHSDYLNSQTVTKRLHIVDFEQKKEATRHR